MAKLSGALRHVAHAKRMEGLQAIHICRKRRLMRDMRKEQRAPDTPQALH